MIIYFQFGYHGLDAWPLVESDPDFDCESTGILRVVADSEEDALRWGIKVAGWYLSCLHGAESRYNWSSDDYAVWTEKDVTEFDDDETIVQVDVGEYPSFEALRSYLND